MVNDKGAAKFHSHSALFLCLPPTAHRSLLTAHRLLLTAQASLHSLQRSLVSYLVADNQFVAFYLIGSRL
jgi:hypothetical protein